jgi:hypothetical protein
MSTRTVRQVPVLDLRLHRLPGWTTGAEDGSEAENRVRNDAANRGKVVEHDGWRTGSCQHTRPLSIAGVNWGSGFLCGVGLWGGVVP